MTFCASVFFAFLLLLPDFWRIKVNICIWYEGAWPEHHCKVPDGALINATIPMKEDGSYDSCHVYIDGYRNETTKCNEWQYNNGDIRPTIVGKVINILLRSQARPM